MNDMTEIFSIPKVQGQVYDLVRREHVPPTKNDWDNMTVLKAKLRSLPYEDYQQLDAAQRMDLAYMHIAVGQLEDRYTAYLEENGNTWPN